MSNELSWLQSHKDGSVILRIHVQPNASKTAVQGVHGDRLKIRLAAPPVDGAANEELLTFLKKTLKKNATHPFELSLIRGQTSRQKDVLCVGLAQDVLERTFAQQAL